MILNEKFLRLHTGLNIDIVEECTNAFDEIGKSDVLIAMSQTHGKGRGDHKFFSPKGGLYMVMRVEGMYIDTHTLTPAVGLALHDAIKVLLGINTRLKWVNDIIYNDRKAAGILCRSPRRAEYLVGVGINYATDPSALANAGLEGVATSLNAPPSRASAFLTGLINQIHRATLATFDNKRYSALCVNIGKTVSFTHNGTPVQGIAESVDGNGSLIVRIGNATVAVDAGEVEMMSTT